MAEKNTQTRPYTLAFPVAAPFDIAYKKDISAYPVGPHSHNAVELYLTLSDLPDVLLNDTVSAVPAGTLIIIPPFCVHQLYHVAGTSYERYILSINNNWLDAVCCDQDDVFSYLRHNGSPLLLTLEESSKSELLKHLQHLLTIPKVTSPDALAGLFTLLSSLNGMVDRISPESNQTFPISPTQKNINEMISYIQEHIYENITVADMAKHFFLHPDYLSRLFKSHAHISISHYITLQKISSAQSLLREGYTVTEVQEKLGYSSYAYFFKTFKKSTGISPSKYRDQYFKG